MPHSFTSLRTPHKQLYGARRTMSAESTAAAGADPDADPDAEADADAGAEEGKADGDDNDGDDGDDEAEGMGERARANTCAPSTPTCMHEMSRLVRAAIILIPLAPRRVPTPTLRLCS